MPNHVENDLTVNGNVLEVKRFMESVYNQIVDENGKVIEKPIDHNKIIPYPEAFLKRDLDAKTERAKGNWQVEDGYNSGGYAWCVENWGTKWGFYHFGVWEVSKTGRSATISFETAWSVAYPLFEKMSQMFPLLTFTIRYFERGMGFCGVYKIRNGEVLKHDETEYKGRRGG